MKKKKLWISIILCLASIISCTAFLVAKHNTTDNSSTKPNVSNNDPFKENNEEAVIRAPGSSNQITTSVISPNPEKMTLEYNGTPILVEYQFTCEKPCTMGLMIYVNGLLQPYTVLPTGKETTMHTVDMTSDDVQTFKFEFTPVCGEKGENLVITFANVYNAKIMELTGDVNTFGNNQKISQPMPWTLKMNVPVNKTDFNISTDFKTQQFSADDKNRFIHTDIDGKRVNMLDGICRIDLRKGNDTLNGKIVFDKTKNSDCTLYVYGNLTGKYRLSLYGDFNKLQINGYDYIEIDVKKGEYTIVPLTLNAEDLQKYKNIFAVTAPMDFNCFLEKTASIYVAEK